MNSGMTSSKKRSRLAALSVAASLIALSVVAIPSVAHASETCSLDLTNYNPTIEICAGTTSDGANYEIQTPDNFNGTVLLWSHGYRYATNLPAGIQPAGGTTAYIVDKSAEIAPTLDVAQTLLSQGYALAGSGFSVQGWNSAAAVKTNVELIGIVKAKLKDTKTVIAWGGSLGGFITQALAEKYPKLIKASAPLCMASGSVDAEMTMAQDLLWGLKTFFDPKIVVSGYASGPQGVGQAALNLGRVVAALSYIGDHMLETDTAKTWPETSTVPAALKAIPARSALLLVGLMAGIPTQSQHIDASSFPGTAVEFALALAPAIATAENSGYAAGLGIFATLDLEGQVGGTFYDNSMTNYAKRITEEREIFNVALSGNNSVDAMLGYLSTPLAPRVKATKNLNSILKHSGKLNVPTVTMAATADMITPAGNSQWLVDKNAKNAKMIAPLWVPTADKYTTFTALGTPNRSGTAWPAGTGHCQFSTDQWVTAAKIAITSAKTGKVPSDAQLTKTVAQADGLVFDRNFRVPVMKHYVK